MGFADTTQPDDTGDQLQFKCSYKYYNFAGNIPVRALVTTHDRWVGTEVLNYETKEFEESDHLVKLINDTAGDFEEITKEKFYKKCDAYLAHWTPEKIKETKANSEQFQKLIDEGFFDD